MNVEEFVDRVQMDLSVSCMLPRILPPEEIMRIMDVSMNYMYMYYPESLADALYFIPNENFKDTAKQGQLSKQIKLPCEVKSIKNIYQANKSALFEFGIHAPNINIGLGISNQPYLSSFVSTIGELGVYKVIIDNFSSMIDKLNRSRLRFDYNTNNNNLNIISPFDNDDIVLHVNEKIMLEDLLNDNLMYRHVVATAKKRLARVYATYQIPLPGDVTINFDMLISEADEELQKVEEEIKAFNTPSFFFNIP